MGGVSVWFHRSGDLLMSTAWDDVTRFWDAATGHELMHTTELAPLGNPSPRSATVFPRVSVGRRLGS